MRVGDLTADSVEVRQVTMDSTDAAVRAVPEWVGTARFEGLLTLRGRLMKHPDSEVRVLCFESDSASAALIPRWKRDTRRAWFCFSNAEAARMLGLRSDRQAVEVTVDRFVIHRSFSDDVNSARLIRLSDLADCYRSPNSVLFGPRTGAGQQGQPPGWVRLEGSSESENGEAELRDSDGKAMRAQWRRLSHDSLDLVAFNDFLRVEIRFLVSKVELRGHGTTRSDAAIESDSNGRVSDLSRSWKFVATAALCDAKH